jgi:hypothetical protein
LTKFQVVKKSLKPCFNFFTCSLLRKFIFQYQHMKPIFIAAVIVLFANAATAQQNVCVQQFSNFSSKASYSIPASEASSIVADILNVMGLKGNFDIRPSDNIGNAAAVIYNGKRFVLYNSSFIGALNETTGNDWASVSVLAHEIGHHLNGHTLAGGSSHSNELEADEFSGYIMQRLGATLEEAEKAMNLAANVAPSSTHPGRTDRLAAIEQGWNRASDQLTADIEENEKGNNTASVPDNKPIAENKPAPVASNTTHAVLAEEFIVADIVLDEDKAGEYYITTTGKMVAVKSGCLFLLGELKESNNPQYPYLIESKNNRLYVDTAGIIKDANGDAVGYLRKHG